MVICKVVLEFWNWVGITKTGFRYSNSTSSSSSSSRYRYIKYYSFVSEYYMIPKFQNSNSFALWLAVTYLLIKWAMYCLFSKMMHSAFKGNERENTPKSVVLEKNWNFGINRVSP